MNNHTIWNHIAAPVWLRLPDNTRWGIVSFLNRSRRQCWADLVEEALAQREDDACDVRVPSLSGDSASRCASVCGWSHSDHAGEHLCSCYCGKFLFSTPAGPHEEGCSRG